MREHKQSSLVSETGKLQRHDHLCPIYKTHNEHEAAVIPFIQAGVCRKMKNSLLVFTAVVTIIIATTITGCSIDTEPIYDEVTLQLKWVHQAQFAGFYMADEKDYYSQENIKVTFLEGGQDVDIAENLLTGKADFAVLSPDELLVKRSQGCPLDSIAAVYRRSAVVFLSKADSGIVRPQDFVGKTIAATATGGTAEFQMQLAAMMKKLQLDTNQVNIVPYDPDYTAFINGEVAVTPAYSTGGLIKLRQEGLELNLIWPSDYAVRFYSDLLVTTDQLITENPDLVIRFLRATLKGWQDAIEDYPQAVDITMKYAEIKDQQLQTAMMEAMLPLVNTGEDKVGWMKSEMWQGMCDIMLDQNLLAEPFDVNQAYTLRFLEQVYGSK